MALWPDMIRCASRGAAALGASAPRAEEFLRSQAATGGGFFNRGGQPDLYYAAFALSALRALGATAPAAARGESRCTSGLPSRIAGVSPADLASVVAYLESFWSDDSLDLIHRSCLARSLASLPHVEGGTPSLRETLAASLARWRAADGGYAQEPGADHGTVYGAFLALGAYQDCGAACPDEEEIARSVLSCRAADGGFANAPGESDGLAPITAGAVAVLHAMGRPVEDQWGRWLIDSCFRDAGFVAHPLSPEPDLLSTAVSLHAVELCGLSLDAPQRHACADFILSLQAPSGGFRGAASDPQADCEYTFYALLALGHVDHGTSP